MYADTTFKKRRHLAVGVFSTSFLTRILHEQLQSLFIFKLFGIGKCTDLEIFTLGDSVVSYCLSGYFVFDLQKVFHC